MDISTATQDDTDAHDSVNAAGATAWRYSHCVSVRTLGWPHAPSFHMIIPDS